MIIWVYDGLWWFLMTFYYVFQCFLWWLSWLINGSHHEPWGTSKRASFPPERFSTVMMPSSWCGNQGVLGWLEHRNILRSRLKNGYHWYHHISPTFNWFLNIFQIPRIALLSSSTSSATRDIGWFHFGFLKVLEIRSSSGPPSCNSSSLKPKHLTSTGSRRESPLVSRMAWHWLVEGPKILAKSSNNKQVSIFLSVAGYISLYPPEYPKYSPPFLF